MSHEEEFQEENIRKQQFYSEIRKPHKRVDPCFMTGKGCVYTEVIDRELKERDKKKSFAGFAIMPLRHNLGVFYKNCLRPFLQGAYGADGKLEVDRGDQVRRPGVIICEGICKRIQESNFVIADISLPNANVFYELGLAYGIGQKIVVIYHVKSTFGHDMKEYFKLDDCRPYAYHGLDPMAVTHFDVAGHIWRRMPVEMEHDNSHPGMLLYENYTTEESLNAEDVAYKDDIELDFQTHVLSAVGLAIAKIYSDLESEENSLNVVRNYLPIIKGLKDVKKIRRDANFWEIREQVDNSYCMIVRTGSKACHPMAYFWLGYGHARGKNVIPITVIKKPRDPVKDLAFDIRSQRHMTFIEKGPELLEGELEQTFRQMISADFSGWSRKRFWDAMLGRRGEVAIFTGALHNDTFDREMIGDWDLRAVSELTSYFGRHQYRARIDSPVYAPEHGRQKEQFLERDRAEYIQQLKEMIEDKNCILIASPDVNPLTEIVLGHAYDIPEDKLFLEPIQTNFYPRAIIVVKEKLGAQTSIKQSALYKEETATEPKRGFASSQISSGRIMAEFVSQVEPQKGFDVYAHLAIVPNPFNKDDRQRRYIIILNGVSGPATFALTHVLTGGVNPEFVSYADGFDPEEKSEEVLQKILPHLQGRKFKVLDCIIKVRVGPSQEAARKNTIGTFEWRRILGWELEAATPGRDIRVE